MVGDRVKILGGTTFGGRLGHGTDYPTIGCDVIVGAGARVLGSVVVGDGAFVGANAVMLSHVEEGTTVVGSPALQVRSYR